MNAFKALELMDKYLVCECGNKQLGGGKGSHKIKDEYFYRSCFICGKIVEVEGGKVTERYDENIITK